MTTADKARRAAGRVKKRVTERAYIRQTPIEGDIDLSRILPATAPGLTGGQRFKSLIFMFMDSFIATDFEGICTQMAFFLMCATLPTVYFIILAVGSFFQNFDTYFLSLLRHYIPTLTIEYLREKISLLMEYGFENKVFIGVLSLVLCTMAAHCILTGINQSYGFARYTSNIKTWVKSLELVAGGIVILTLLMNFFMIAESAREWLRANVGGFLSNTLSWSLFSRICSMVMLFVLILSLYVHAPQKRLTVRDALPGTVFSLLTINILFRIYLYFLNISARFLIVYGSLSSLFVLLAALFFLSTLLNLGAKINVVFAIKNPPTAAKQTDWDKQTGADKQTGTAKQTGEDKQTGRLSEAGQPQNTGHANLTSHADKPAGTTPADDERSPAKTNAAIQTKKLSHS